MSDKTNTPDRGAVLDVVGDKPIELADVVDRDALSELCTSIHSLFSLGVRVYAADGALLATAATELDACRYVNQFSDSRSACGRTVSGAKSVDPGESGDVTHPCFTGLAYRIMSLEHEGRRVGRSSRPAAVYRGSHAGAAEHHGTAGIPLPDRFPRREYIPA